MPGATDATIGRVMSRLWLLGGTLFVAALLVASIAIAQTRQLKPLPEGTPERSVQLFLTALEEEDYKGAYELLTRERKADCTIEEFVSRGLDASRDLRDSRITLKDTISLDGTRIVSATVTRVRNRGPFGASDYTQNQSFTLTLQDELWRLEKYSWPYLGCGSPGYARPPPVPRPAVAPLREMERAPLSTTSITTTPDGG